MMVRWLVGLLVVPGMVGSVAAFGVFFFLLSPGGP